MATDPNREVSLEELEAKYLKYVEDKLDYIQSALSSPEYVAKASHTVQTMIELKGRIDGLRKKAVAGKLTLGEAIQHFKTEKKKRKPRRRKVPTRYERIIKNFL
jgi:hypothetical protein